MTVRKIEQFMGGSCLPENNSKSTANLIEVKKIEAFHYHKKQDKDTFLSMLLWNIVLEIPANAVRKNKRTKNWKNKREESLLLAVEMVVHKKSKKNIKIVQQLTGKDHIQKSTVLLMIKNTITRAAKTMRHPWINRKKMGKTIKEKSIKH